jgi:predicted LPLAT superfamily acyltransferase
MSATPRSWEQQRERGSALGIAILVWIARRLGRPVARLLLYPIAVYFLLTGRAARRASRDYLRRVLPQAPRWRDVMRHFFCFAAVSLDRVFWMFGGRQQPEVVTHRPDEVYRAQHKGIGCLLLAAHYGSFEIRQASNSVSREVPLRIVLDRAHGGAYIRFLERLNPQVAASIIDASREGPGLMLEIKQALDSGTMVGLMADRVRDGERAVEVDFLGGKARLPALPWILAGLLGVPVVLAFGIYRGGKRYDAVFELLAEHVELPRANREQAIRGYAQQYADRLAHHARSAPYNWFNFYDFWHA